jgi:hypothetical protein
MTWEDLTKVIPPEQRDQLAQLLAERYAEGYGVLEIHFAKHQIDLFYTGKSIKPARNAPGPLPQAFLKVRK